MPIIQCRIHSTNETLRIGSKFCFVYICKSPAVMFWLQLKYTDPLRKTNQITLKMKPFKENGDRFQKKNFKKSPISIFFNLKTQG